MIEKITEAWLSGLLWGLLMFVWMELAIPLRKKKEFTAKGVVQGVIRWLICGSLIFGYLTNLGKNKDENPQNQKVELTKNPGGNF